jgi:CRP-like cAMP-binding protein
MEKYLKMLETIALFDGIDRDNLETLLHCLKAKIVHYNKDDIIFMAGEKINNLGIVLSGQVQIVQNDYYGNKCIIGNAEVGQLFGEYFFKITSPSLPVKISKGSPSLILRVLLISLGITTLPRSSILLTIPVAFTLFPGF